MRVLLALCLILLAPLAFAAGATDTSIFNIPLNDQSVLFLSEIFGKVGNVIGGATSTPLRIVILLFNNIALVVGGFIILYTIIVSTINTSNDGELLGKKWNSVWIPMRAAIGFGLLLPAGTNGYALVQVAVMWIVVQGVGAANYVWGQYLKNVAIGNASPQQPYVSQSTMQNVAKVFQNASCAYAIAANSNIQNQMPVGMSSLNTTDKISPVMNVPTALDGGKIQFGTTDENGNISYNCGSVTLQKTNTVAISKLQGDPTIGAFQAAAFYQAQENGAFKNVLGSVQGNSLTQYFKSSAAWTKNQSLLSISRALYNLADYYVNTSNYCNNNSDRNCVNTVQRQIMTQAENYVAASTTYENREAKQAKLNSLAKQANAIANSGQTPRNNPLIATSGAVKESYLYQAQQFGWIYAGSYYLILSSLTSEINQDSDTNMIPAPQVTSPVIPLDTLTNNPTATTIANNIVQVSTVCGTSTSDNLPPPTSKAVPCIPNELNTGGPSSVTNVDLGQSDLGPVATLFSNALTDCYTMFLNYLGNKASTGNPLVTLSSVGSNMIYTAVSAYVVGGALLVGSSALAGGIPLVSRSVTAQSVVQAIQLAVSIFIIPVLAVVAAFAGFGAIAGYYLPLIPYFLFTVGALAWLFLVIEAMVAAPILALGIIHPEGGHDIWGKSEQGITMLLGIFLRPALMIIGFVAASVLIYIAFNMVNGGFYTAISSLSLGVVGVTAMLLIYIGVITFMCHQCFKLIYKLPDQILRWIGGTPETAGGEGDQEVGSGMQKTSGMGDQMGKASAESMRGFKKSSKDRSTAAFQGQESEAAEQSKSTETNT